MKFPGLGALLFLLLASTPALAIADSVPQPHVTGAISQSDGRIVLFKTDDPHLYYLVPERWQIIDNQVSVGATENAPGHYTLSFVMTPNYAWSDDYQRAIRAEDPQAMFIHVPRKYTSVSASVPPRLGRLRSRLLPTDQLSSGELFYYRLDLTETELQNLRATVANHNPITGSVAYAFPGPDTPFTTAADVLFNFTSDELLTDSVVPDNFLYLRCTMTSWANLSTEAQMRPLDNTPSTMVLDVSVTEPWMLDGGDNCTLTGTSTAGQWTDVSNYAPAAGTIVAPGQPFGMTKTAEMTTFVAKFPQLGPYRLFLNRRTGKFYFDPLPMI